MTDAGELARPTGPRGGTTTVTASGLVKKNLWVSQEDAEALRRLAFEQHTSEAEIIREGIRRVLHDESEASRR